MKFITGVKNIGSVIEWRDSKIKQHIDYLLLNRADITVEIKANNNQEVVVKVDNDMDKPPEVQKVAPKPEKKEVPKKKKR